MLLTLRIGWMGIVLATVVGLACAFIRYYHIPLVALVSIPKHQYESSAALGMTGNQTFLHIIIPQTLRRLVPLSINLITRMIKTTSLVMMIGVVEVLKVAQQIIEANRMSSPNAAFGIYGTVFFLYFIICWPISLFAGYLEKRWGV
ncbi:MAG: ABC transporter permease subunit [Lachnospiraceae bacterium]|nr:ABC transporter permease subunit [Lachnospiraceae bacterium]